MKKGTRWRLVRTREEGDRRPLDGERKSVLLFSRRRGARPTCVRACVRSFVRSFGSRYEKKKEKKKKKENERESRVEDRGRDLRWILRIVGHLLRTYIFDLEICFMQCTMLEGGRAVIWLLVSAPRAARHPKDSRTNPVAPV